MRGSVVLILPLISFSNNFIKVTQKKIRATPQFSLQKNKDRMVPTEK